MNILIKESANYKDITLSPRQLCDIELLMNGGFYPLNTFLSEENYYSVLDNMRLTTGELWPMPIVLSVNDNLVDKIKNEKNITLKDEQNVPLAILRNPIFYKPNLDYECKKAYGTNDDNHPYVKIIMDDKNVYYVTGELVKIQLPLHYDFNDIRLTPIQTKEYFKDNGWKKVVAFQTRNPMHRSHMELTKYALKCAGEDSDDKSVKLLIHPVVGVTQTCDVGYHTRVRCYKKLLNYYPNNTAIISLLPLSMRMAGPREALWHALIRQNYGCTHFVVGRDHAGPSFNKKNGDKFYGPYDAHDLIDKYSDELSIKVVKAQLIVYVKESLSYMPINSVPKHLTVMNISGTEQRRMLREGEDIPEWFSYPDIVKELRKDYKPNLKKGFCLYLVGLSGSGKSTIANALKSKLEEFESDRKITVLDGDIIRHHLSKGLGFSKNDRSINVRRIGYVASEIVKHGGIVICSNIAPYRSDREYNKELIKSFGGYYELFVDTPINICEKRDVKGLYKLARQGIIKEFTGISDPFELPEKPNLKLIGDGDINFNINKILNLLRKDLFI